MGDESSKYFYLCHNELSINSYLLLPRVYIIAYGLETAVFLSDLSSKEKYFRERDMLEDNFFFLSENDREYNTGLSPYRQRAIIKTLSELGLLETKRIGLPARIWFKIDWEKIWRHLSKFKEAVVKKSTTIKSNKYNNNKVKKTKVFLNCPDSCESGKTEKKINASEDIPETPRRRRRKTPRKILEEPRTPSESSGTEPTGSRRRWSPSIRATEADINFVDRAITLWKKQPRVIKHKKGTKTYDNIKLKLVSLLRGKFGDNFAVNEAFAQKKDIPDMYLNRKWDEDRLLAGIKNLAKLSLDGYYPMDKTNVRNLDSLIYNGISGTSMLLAVMRKEPTPILNQNIKNEFPKITNMFKAKSRENTNDPLVFSKLIYNVAKLEKKYSELIKFDKDGRFATRFPIFEYFAKNYIDWIDRQSWIRSFSISLANPESRAFAHYSKELNEDFAL